MATQQVGFLRLEDVAAMPEESIQIYLQSKRKQSQGSNNDLITAIILYHNDNYLVPMDSQVVKYSQFAQTMLLTQKELINRVISQGVQVQAIMTKYDLIRVLLLSKDNFSTYLSNAAKDGHQGEVIKF